MPGWEDNLVGRCAGEQVAAVVDKQLFFIMDIAVITRVLAPAPPTSRHFGILAAVSDKCDPASTIRPGTRVTMSTVATLPDCEYTFLDRSQMKTVLCFDCSDLSQVLGQISGQQHPDQDL